jgi:hypothetical protein
MTSNTFAFRLLFNYLPTATAAIIEICWVVLSRTMCQLQPLLSMRVQKQPSQKSLSLRYASFPPVFAIFQSFKTRHFALAAICLVSLSMNVLTVAFGTLFNRVALPVSTSQSVQFPYAPTLRGGALGDFNKCFVADCPSGSYYIDNSPLYKASAAITGSVPYPPWTTEGLFFLPFTPPLDDFNTTYTAVTTGIQAELDCQPLTKTNSNLTISGGTTNLTALAFRDMTFDLEFNASFVGQTYQNCSHSTGPLLTSNGSSSAELYDWAGCGTHLLAAWFRANSTTAAYDFNDVNELMPGSLRNISYEAVVCAQSATASSYEVTVDGLGVVQSYKAQISSIAKPVTVMNGTLDFLFRAVAGAFQFGLGELSTGALPNNFIFHNDSSPTGWISYMAGRTKISNETLNPAGPLPDVQQAAEMLQTVYQTFVAVSLAEYMDELFVPQNTSSTGSKEQSKPLVLVRLVPFILSAIILTFGMAVGSYIYMIVLRGNLPEIPDCLGAMIYMMESKELFGGSSLRSFGSETEKL